MNPYWEIAMSTKQNTVAVREIAAALQAGDLEKALDFYADDVQWTVIGTTPYSGTYNGKEDLKNRLYAKVGEAFEGGLEITVDNVIADGDYAAYQLRATAKTKRGEDYRNTFCIVYHFSDGKAASVTEYLDTDLLTRVLS